MRVTPYTVNKMEWVSNIGVISYPSIFKITIGAVSERGTEVGGVDMGQIKYYYKLFSIMAVFYLAYVFSLP